PRGWSVSQTIWTRCAGSSEVGPLGGRFHRVVEAQFRNSTRKLCDSDEEQQVLESLIDERAKAPVPAGFEGLHYLLYTPFRHPPLRNGSRFGTRGERGILYGAKKLPAARAAGRQSNVAVLENVFAPRAPTEERGLRCTANRLRVEIRGRELLSPDERWSFERGSFEVAGRLPSPAT